MQCPDEYQIIELIWAFELKITQLFYVKWLMHMEKCHISCLFIT